jgi:uncharacterized membrane protein YdjX (TVP38/TMEM64 family)
MTADKGRRTEDEGQKPDDAQSAAPAITALARQRLAPWPVGLRVVVLLLVIVALVAPLFIWKAQIEAIFAEREHAIVALRDAGAWGPLVLIGLYIAQVIIAPIPGQAVSFVAGYVYGFWLGLLYSWLGAVIGSTAAMGLARLAGRPLIVRFVSPDLLDRLDRLAAGRGLGFFFLVFLIPGLPDDAACFLAGLTPLPLSALIVAAAIGRTPGIAAAVWAGASAERIGWQAWLILGGLAVAAAFVMWRYGAHIQEGLLRLASRLSSTDKYL